MNYRSFELFLSDANATRRLGYLLGRHLPAGSTIFLKGDLGAGKTTLVQGLGQSLGITEAIASPTFTLVNEYTNIEIPLYHLDLYRLSAEQASTIYPEIYWEGIEVLPGITAIEWSERLEYKPDNYLEINLFHDTKRGRHATLNLIGEHDLNLSFLLNFASTQLN